MWSKSREIAEGDTIIVWMVRPTPLACTGLTWMHQTREQLLPVVVTTGQELNGRFGYYRHEDLIGVPYGSKVASRNGRGFIHVLRPTPELWTRALPHRTQILYMADIAFVTAWLNVRPGSTVVEAGACDSRSSARGFR
jgi:tRNA (adenine57-N1/adenine58-N1)-methyltransferase catalytic subunit